MSLEQIYYIGQNLAVLLLLVSIVFVGLQIRQNTQSNRAAAAYDVMKTWGEFNRELAQDPEATRLVFAAVDPKNKLEDFSPVERAQLLGFVRSVLQHWMSQYFLFKEGSLPRNYWETIGIFAGSFVEIPTIKAFSDAERAAGIGPPEFWAEIERLHQENPSDLSAMGFGIKPTSIEAQK